MNFKIGKRSVESDISMAFGVIFLIAYLLSKTGYIFFCWIVVGSFSLPFLSILAFLHKREDSFANFLKIAGIVANLLVSLILVFLTIGGA